MIRLTTLGALDLRHEDGKPADAVLRQPKRLALLAYLAIARPRGFQRRDRVLATFWPELDRDRARGALNQSVFTLRQALGQEVVVNRGAEEIGIPAEALWCDAVGFDEAFDRGDFEEALALYRGELLAGFHVDDAADFERWLDEERSHYAQRAADAAWSLAERAGGGGEIGAARDWAARAISFHPWDERGLRRLMMLLDGAGDRAGAIAAFNDFAKRLRADLEVDPSAETLELVESIKARAEPNGGPEPAPLLSAPVPAEAPQAPAPATPRERRFAPAEVVPKRAGTRATVRRFVRELRWTTVLLIAFVGALVAFIIVPPDPPGPIRVAVMPLRDESPDTQYRHITGALTTTIIQLMHHPKSLQVVSQLDVLAYADSSLTHDEIARRFGVDYIVSGSLTGSGDRIKVTLELIDSETGDVIDGFVSDKEDSDWLAFSDDVGEDLARLLRRRLGREYRAQQWQAATTREDAWEALAKANELFLLGRAAEDHPPFAHALKLYSEAEAVARAAQRGDPGWHEPYLMLARLIGWRAFLSAFDPAFPAATRNAMFDSALAYAEQGLHRDRGGDAAALEMRGTLRVHRYKVARPSGDSGKALLDLAESDLRQALQLDESRARAASTLFYINYERGQLQEAERYARQALENDPYLEEIANTVNNLFAVTFHLGDDKDASYWCEQVADYMPDTYPVAICRLMLLSWGSEAPQSARNALVQLASAGAAESKERRPKFEPMLMALTVPAVWRDSIYGGPDSARALLDSARTLPGGQTPDFMEFEAAALVAMEAYDAAFATLVEIVGQQPDMAARLRSSRFFQPLYAKGEAYALTQAVVLAASASR